MNIRRLDLNLLVALDALLETQNVSAAAKRLGLSQPAMSNALRRLRQSLGDQILVRAGAHMIPTPRADGMRPVIRDALLRIETALTRPEPLDPARLNEPITIAAADYVVGHLAAPLQARLTALGARSQLRFVNLTDGRAADALISGDVALALSSGMFARDHFMRLKLADETFTCLMRADHPLAHGDFDAPSFASASHVLVAPLGASPRGMIDDHLEALGLSREVSLLVPNFYVVAPIIAASDLIVTLPTPLAVALARHYPLTARPLPIHGVGFGSYAYWHPRLHDDPLNIWLRQVIRAAYHRSA